MGLPFLSRDNDEVILALGLLQDPIKHVYQMSVTCRRRVKESRHKIFMVKINVLDIISVSYPTQASTMCSKGFSG